MDIGYHPLVLVLATYCLACVIVFCTDPFALPRQDARRYKIPRTLQQVCIEGLARLPIIAVIYAGFFAISWRPLYTLQATISVFAISTAISRAKFMFIREPLIFSDVALLTGMFKHKEIFYATFLDVFFWILALGYVLGGSALYMWLEPSVLPARHQAPWIAFGVFLACVPWLLPFVAISNGPLVRFSEWLLKTLDPGINTVRFGAFSTVIYHFIIWLGRAREDIIADLRKGLQQVLYEAVGYEKVMNDGGPPLIVVWQSESFLDLRLLGAEDLDLPHLDHLQQRAVQWGRMTSVFEGGYTLRTEFSVITGLQPEEAYADASYPYLRAARYRDIAWPSRLRDCGWFTHFIHPFDRGFFSRDKAMPLLGFQQMSMLDAFAHDPAKDGPYVSDRRLTQTVIEAITATDSEKPAFFFVASMANHGPWAPGRCGALSDPVEIYKELLRKSDDALGYLTAQLDGLGRPVWLVFYGDHAPLLKRFADPFPDPRTNYVIVPLGTADCPIQRPVVPVEEAPWNLINSLLVYTGFHRKAVHDAAL